jgi:MOSC domain-containing protein YiiM
MRSLAEEFVSGFIEKIFWAPAAGADMRSVEAIEALADSGLRGDRYAARAGHWTGGDACQITLMEAEALDEITATTRLRVRDGEHRRNLVTRGIRLEELSGRRFQIGEAVLEFDRPRPPCRYLQSLTQQQGLTAALEQRGGVCARVVRSGVIRVHDAILVLEPEPNR